MQDNERKCNYDITMKWRYEGIGSCLVFAEFLDLNYIWQNQGRNDQKNPNKGKSKAGHDSGTEERLEL